MYEARGFSRLILSIIVILELSECTTFSIAFRRLARSIIFSQLEEVVDIIYIDFTDNSRDAQLNVSEKCVTEYNRIPLMITCVKYFGNKAR